MGGFQRIFALRPIRRTRGKSFLVFRIFLSLKPSCQVHLCEPWWFAWIWSPGSWGKGTPSFSSKSPGSKPPKGRSGRRVLQDLTPRSEVQARWDPTRSSSRCVSEKSTRWKSKDAPFETACDICGRAFRYHWGPEPKPLDGLRPG